MYTQIVALLFPLYLCGCLVAIALSWSKRSLYLSFFYTALLGIFQLMITGQAAAWGGYTFLGCSIVQFTFMGLAYFSECKPSRHIIIGAVIGITVNALEYILWTVGYPQRLFYFITVNAVQIYQIASMVFLSPAALILYRHLPRKRSIPWQTKADFGIASARIYSEQ